MRPLLIIFVCILGLYLFKVFFLDAAEKSEPGNTAVSAENKKAEVDFSVDIYIAKEVDKSNSVFSSGTIVANEEVDIKSEASGRLVRLQIKEGGLVKKGQLIAKLNDEELLAQLKKLKYEEEFAAQIEARQRKLLDIDAISKEEYEMSVNSINTLSADRELLEVQLAKTSIVAPFTGRLGMKNISEGAYITPEVVIVNLIQSDPAKIDFNVPEKYANKIKLGQEILFSTDGDDEKFPATVMAIDPKIDENLRTLKIRASAPNPSGNLLPGMFIQVELPLGDEKSIMIPSESIIPILKGKKVFVVKNGLAKEQIIQTGLRTDTKVQVVDGLSVGDTVVVSALMSVKENTPIEIRNIIQ